MELQKSVDYFLLAHRGIISPNTVKTYSSRLQRFASFSKQSGPVEVANLNPQCVTRFFHHLHTERNFSAGTIRGYGQTISTFLRWLERSTQLSGQAEQFIACIPKVRVGRRVIEVLSEDELASLFSTITDGRDYAIIATLLGTGLKTSELTALRTDDVNLEQGLLKVEEPHFQKCSSVHFIPLTPVLAGILRIYLEQIRPSLADRGMISLFVSKRGKKLGSAGLYRVVRRWLSQAKIDKRLQGPRLLRQTFIWTLREKGVAMSTIASIMGCNYSTSSRVLSQTFMRTPMVMAEIPELLELAARSPIPEYQRLWNV